jgi:hypothetical protein
MFLDISHFLFVLNYVKSYESAKLSFKLSFSALETKDQHKRSTKNVNHILCLLTNDFLFLVFFFFSFFVYFE